MVHILSIPNHGDSVSFSINLRSLGLVHTLSIPNHPYSWVILLHLKAISRDSLNTLPINPYLICSKHFTRESHAHTPYQSLTVGTLFPFNQSEASRIESIQWNTLRDSYTHPINPYPFYSKHFTRESHTSFNQKLTHSL